MTINVTSINEGTQCRVVKSTANGNWYNAPPVDLVLGNNTIFVNAVDFSRTVKFQFSSGDIEFDALIVNDIQLNCNAGCTDLIACNYNSSATYDDGSCIYPESLNYSFLYNKQGWSGAGSCIVSHDEFENAILMDVTGNNPVMRSPDSLEINADEFGSLTISIKNMSSVSNGFKLQYLEGLNTLIGDVTIPVDINMTEYMEYTVSLSSLNNLGTIDRLGFKGPFQSSGDSVYIKSIILNKYIDCGECNVDLDEDGVCDNLEVFGCTDFLATNFDSLATEDDESCVYNISGCTDEMACNYNELATEDDNSCFYPESLSYSFLYNKQGWSGAGGCIVTHDDDENAILMDVTGNNPVMRSPQNLNLDASDYGSVSITLKNMSSVSSGFRLQYLQGTSELIDDVQVFVDTNM